MPFSFTLLLVVLLTLSVSPSQCKVQFPVPFAFGSNIVGQLGDGFSLVASLPVQVDSSGVLNGEKIISASAGASFSLALSESGKVFSFGSNSAGQLGDGTFTPTNVPVAVDTSGVLNGTRIIAISAGQDHSLVLSESGKVFSFGNNYQMQLGDGTQIDRNRPVAVDTSGPLNETTFSAISGGGGFSMILSSTGQVYTFGGNTFGQLGDGTNNMRNRPGPINTSGVLSGLEIKAIAAGGWFSLVLSTTGKVFSFGYNYWGQLGDGTTTERYNPVAVNSSGVLNGLEITAIAAGESHSLVVSATGKVFSFGMNNVYQLGDGTQTSRPNPVAVNTSGVLNGTHIVAVAGGRSHSLALSATGRVYSFGFSLDGQLGNGSWYSQQLPVEVSKLDGLNNRAIAAGSAHSLVVSGNGQLFSFGSKKNGQIGDGTAAISRNSPFPVSTSGVLKGLEIVDITAGSFHSLILSATGKVFSFGGNSYGQLGNSNSGDQNSPVAVSTSGVLNGVHITGIAAGQYHSLVLSSNGSVFSFGSNEFGQLGDGTNTNRNIPVAVNMSGVLNGTRITAIACGFSHSLVLSANGTVFAFGYNLWGQLGDGTNTSRFNPVAVNTSGVLDGLSITAIAGGSSHSLVLSATGKVFSFGYNPFGQLGDGTTTHRYNPVAVNTSGVLDGVSISAIACGLYQSLVLSSTGEVFSFGYNNNGQLGDGTTIDRHNPVAVNTSGVLDGVSISGIACGFYHSLVLSSTGKVFAFGSNSEGQLGDGTNTNSLNPVAVLTSGSLNGLNITAISSGNSHVLLLTDFSTMPSFSSSSSFPESTSSDSPAASSSSNEKDSSNKNSDSSFDNSSHPNEGHRHASLLLPHTVLVLVALALIVVVPC